YKTLKYIFIILFFAWFIPAGAQDAQEIIKKVQSNYKSIKDAKANFSHSSTRNSGSSQSSSGTIYIQKEEKYRIETKGQVIVTDGVTSWSYSIKKKQVIIDNYKSDGNTFSPNKYLFNYPENFYSDLEGSENISDIDCYILKLTPRSKGSVKSAKIWVDKTDYLIRKITINASDGTDTYILKKIALDTGISSSKFSFSPPGDTEVIDLR
ncbi:MAG: outer membrane lipoprotein carrier protein LolA, partial [Ignavibacteriae bacterium]|nr:outer membrane lipoprotein carrier protein LolA [Ignavibacteriota bacterium]